MTEIPARSAAQISPPLKRMNFVPFACCEGLSPAESSPSESFSEDAASSTPKAAAQRLEHYELVTDKDGQPDRIGSRCDGCHLQSV